MQKELKNNLKFGKITILSDINKYKRNNKVLIKCDCGYYKKIILKDILYGKSKSCGHCKSRRIKIGDIFQELKVISICSHKSICKCSCGVEKEILTTELLQGKHSTCGGGIHRRGELGNNWKGGIRNFSNTIRKSKEYNEWRTKCFERDNYTCQISGQKGGDIVVHHLTPFNIIISDLNINIYRNCELLWDLDNGITITKELHNQFHKKYGKKYFTKENFNSFKDGNPTNNSSSNVAVVTRKYNRKDGADKANKSKGSGYKKAKTIK